MASDQNHQQQDNNRNERKCPVINDLARHMRLSSAPFPYFDPVFHTHLVQVLQIVCKFARTGATFLRITLQSAVEDFLELPRDGRIGIDVVGCAEGGGEVRIGEAASEAVAGNAEVDQFHVVVLVEDDNFGLEVAADDDLLVDVLESVEDLDGDSNCAIFADAAVG